MGFVSCYGKSEKYVEYTREVLCTDLFPGWEKNAERTGVDLVHPLFIGGCEVKADFQGSKTGNIFFETSCSGKDSGIFKYKDNILFAQWIVGVKDEVIIFDCRKLKEIIKNGKFLSGVGDGNADGYLLKIELVKNIALIHKSI